MTAGKYSASGNDFVIFHTFVKVDRSDLARRLCHRHEGIGADGLIVLLPHPEYDFQWQFYNADGSEAEMCGNGSRAAALYAHSNGLAGARMRFLTLAGLIEAEVEGNVVTSELTPPVMIDKTIEAFGETWWLINTGVPHLVALKESVDRFDIEEARTLRQRYNANVNIAAVDGDILRVRTYERGVEEETLACGTGMAACFYRANLEKRVPDRMSVVPRSGERLHLAKKGETLTLKGEVRHTFDAAIDKLTTGEDI
ncbi:diaminopimelate epimerase [Hydrogenimonas urashimensis]|uniref:diaminopimelate epimerase n=1 Tax=Hydrogenimonas urashimensis TaxID=2740515 RepID=UPI001916C2C0|nr:diaminopimelate epimerase [Hydrogenimonas urashimensis]